MYLINARADAIAEAIDGVILASGGRLRRLDGFPHIRVVVRADWDTSQVALISGGGSGHEPAHAGFVGKGMLTAAVCGDIFASPSVEAILAGILAVTGPAGCLLIVKNYTGDRLNFGLAAERARKLGHRVEMVVVDDDVALPDVAQARGLAGTLLVHKIAGALAEDGGSLEAVYRAAKQAASRIRTIGLSLNTCSLPGAPAEDRIPKNRAELGLGIHGEPGADQIPCGGSADAMSALLSGLGPNEDGRRHVALLNNLGGTTALEMSVLTRDLYKAAADAGISHIVGPGALMTSLDMHGVSLTLMAVDNEELNALCAPTDCVAWPGCNSFGATPVVEMPGQLNLPEPAASDDPTARNVIAAICAAIIDAEYDLNALDARIGDGDTGTTLASAARDIEARLSQLPLAQADDLFLALSQRVERTMGGSSGVLASIFFVAASEASSSGDDLGTALSAGLARMQEIGGAAPGDRTAIDALSPALAALPEGLAQAAAAARRGANATATMNVARAGRAAYVGAPHLEGQTDPGAEAVARMFEAIVA